MGNLLQVFQELDWTTPSKSAKWPWRVSVCVLLSIGVATTFLHLLFPDTLWFIKFWIGLAVGTFIGMIPGVTWQLLDERRRPSTSGLLLRSLLLGTGLFSCISLFLLVPDLHGQEAERSRIRSLTAQDVAAISVTGEHGRVWRVRNPDSIAMFVSAAKQAELFYPSHESSITEFHLSVELVDGSSLDFEGRIPERHANDVSLSFRGYFAITELLLPGGRQWLDSVARAGS